MGYGNNEEIYYKKKSYELPKEKNIYHEVIKLVKKMWIKELDL